MRSRLCNKPGHATGLDLASSAVAPSAEAPFFIVGAGRSGTTLLRLMLAGHSRIEIPPETWFILPLVHRRLPLDRPLTPEQVSEAVDIVTGDYRWPDMGIAADAFRADASALANPHLVDVINIVYRHHLAAAGKRRFGDKTPPYIEILRELDMLYPGAKFIHLIRDGRDVAISHIELGWRDRGSRCYERDFDWTHALRFRDSYRGTDIDRRILDVKYEDLVSEPEPTIRRICDFLGEIFEPAMLDVSVRTDRVPARERVIHPKLSRPLSKDAASRWQTKLSGFECFIMEACLQRDLRKWGYRLRFASLAWRPFLVGSGWVLLGVGPLLVRAIPYLYRRGYWPKAIYI